jgi:hypothetical protein
MKAHSGFARPPHTLLSASQSCHSQPGNKFVAQSLEAALERRVVLHIPLRAILARHSVSARERNVQYVVLVMTGVAVDRSTVACRRKCNRGLADQWLTIVSIGVSPYAIHLQFVSRRERTWSIFRMLTNLLPHTTAITLRGSMPYFSGSKDGLVPSFPKTTKVCTLAFRSEIPTL